MTFEFPREEKEVKIGDVTFVVQEITLRPLWVILRKLSDAKEIELVAEITETMLPRCLKIKGQENEITFEDILDIPVSVASQLYPAFEEVNAHFLQILEQKGIIKPFRQALNAITVEEATVTPSDNGKSSVSNLQPALQRS